MNEEPEIAVKYTYDQLQDKWKREKVQVTFADKPFAQGGMRVCYKMVQVSPPIEGVLVAKMFTKQVKPEIYFEEAMTQMLADSYALEFNKRSRKRKVCFLPVSVYQLRERGGQLVNVEPFLKGDYIKHNDNDGNVETGDELPQAFSHFSWEASNGQLLIVDIQGVANFYTDPQVHIDRAFCQIHSQDGQSFGQGNLGMKGIESFLSTHTCNSICRSLRLPQYQFGRCVEEVEEQQLHKQALVDDDRRSQSPLRWNSGNAYGRGLERAVSSITSDDSPPKDRRVRERPASGYSLNDELDPGCKPPTVGPGLSMHKPIAKNAGGKKKLMSSFDDLDEGPAVSSFEFQGLRLSNEEPAEAPSSASTRNYSTSKKAPSAHRSKRDTSPVWRGNSEHDW
ncbi:hypothetical protein GUITHDRAFT_147562 [Guillardia theta CCMP2712]|uniref:Alpha-type protein kinase domain-containing protein n=1 Tax=Guillardia theta (strain CCMP2712) TaxID=905079 RepID=L1ICX2_GUITC|nr:hypothetical protein GUITHDRAFT_147562 [Guillardia theta CCMP2712]EKX33932.1 hypothetical protein GUITHDRAFT_147562 [Guillardia theta CCMP2712]|eukprot:XP_005820912.1 hypothetical protein GUITHDRAFT_147562 [Guillardia theta CCMP2712]